MKKFYQYFNILLIVFMLSGCSLIPRLTFNRPGMVPQIENKQNDRYTCKGKSKFNDAGLLISCERGYYSKLNTYNKTERKYTLKEKILNFFSNLVGWSFWIVIALVVFAPGVVGALFGRLIESSVGVTGRALKAVVTGVQKAKRNGGNYLEELRTEQDKDKQVKKKINQLRSEI